MPKQYMVELAQDERDELEAVLKSSTRRAVSATKLQRARILLAVDQGGAGPALTNMQVVDALGVTERTCRTCVGGRWSQWHSFSEFCHSVKDSVLGLGYPLIFYSVSELPVPVLLFLAATFRPVFGIAVHRTGSDGAVADTGRSRRPYESRFPGGRMHAEVAGSRCWPPPPQVRA